MIQEYLTLNITLAKSGKEWRIQRDVGVAGCSEVSRGLGAFLLLISWWLFPQAAQAIVFCGQPVRLGADFRELNLVKTSCEVRTGDRASHRMVAQLHCARSWVLLR